MSRSHRAAIVASLVGAGALALLPDLAHRWAATQSYGDQTIDGGTEVQYGGVSGYGRVQVSRRWWIQARGDLLGIPMKTPDGDHEEGTHEEEGEDGHLERGDRPWRASFMTALVLSEFTALRLQYDHLDRIVEDPENRVMLQLNITFGAHPAHSY